MLSLIKRLVTLSFIFSPLLAMASSSSMSFAPPASDYSMVYLEDLFGVVDGVLNGTGSQIMGAIFNVFNSAVLALGGIVIMYTLIVGTMNTAHEGKMLGQKWSSIWIPVRATIGLALLIPKTTGYCLMQIFVMWIVVQGVGAADKVWNAALNYLNTGGVIVQAQMMPYASATADTSAIATGAQAILAGQVCMLGLQTQLETQRQNYLTSASSSTPSGPCAGTPTATMAPFCSTSVPDLIATVDAIAYQTNNQPNGKGYYQLSMPYFSATSTSPYAFLSGICGYITWDPIPPSTMSTVDTNIPNMTTESTDSVTLSRATAIQQMYIDLAATAATMISNDPAITVVSGTASTPAYANQANTVFGVPYLSTGTVCTTTTSACNLWQGAAGSDGTTQYAPLFTGLEIQNAIADYNAIMMPTLNLIQMSQNASTANNVLGFISGAEQQGWSTAGTYFFDLAFVNSSATANQNTTDTNSGLNTSSPNPGNLIAPFASATTSPVYCPSNNPFSTLCTYFSGNLTPLQYVYNLITGSPSPSALTSAPQPVTTSTLATTQQVASSVFGFTVNSLIIQPPGGQPGLTAPKFNMNFGFTITTGQPLLPSTSFPCGKILGICIAGDIVGGIYNDILQPIINFFYNTMTNLEDDVLFAVLSMPLMILQRMLQNGMSFIQNPGANPIVALASMGTYFINESIDFFFQLVNLVVMTFMIPIYGVILGMFVTALILIASPFFISWIGIFMTIGFSTAYYVPLVPYTIFTFGVIAWLGAVIEAMVAAPIVALGVTHPEGEGMMGKGEQAIMILLNVFLRPSMMIIGYIAGIALCYVSVWVLNSGFSHIIQFIQGSSASEGVFTPWKGGTGYVSWAGLYGGFFSMVVYATLYITVAQKSFPLIYMLPDNILRWIGGHAEQTGQQTAQWGEELKGKIDKAGEETGVAEAQAAKSAKGAATEAAKAAATGGESAAVDAGGAAAGGAAAGGGGGG